MTDSSNLVVIAGPNGAGKSTVAPSLLPDRLGISHFVNADTIASGLSAFAPEQAAISAGRIMLRELDELARQRINFAFETTLATKTLENRLERFRSLGYQIHLLYIWIPSPELSLNRIQTRVQLGGHNVPEVDVRRRYQRSIWNLLHVYRTIVDTWDVYDNSGSSPTLVAGGGKDHISVQNEIIWQQILNSAPRIPNEPRQ